MSVKIENVKEHKEKHWLQKHIHYETVVNDLLVLEIH